MYFAKIASSFVILVCLIATGFAARSASATPQATADAEKTIWELEHSYWHFVETNDLTSYRNLWHADFLGWPSMSSAPVRKDHITDSITSQTNAGRSFKLIDFKPAAIQSSGTTIVVCYWATFTLTDKANQAEQRTSRITHTWIKNGEAWQIIGGMSMPEPKPTQK